MKRLALMLVVLSGLSCGGGGGGSACCKRTVIPRSFGYVGAFTSDGGVATDVQLIVGASGEAKLSFLRGGERVEQAFQVSIP